MKKKLFISIIICSIILIAVSGVWICRKIFISGENSKIDGRFDFYIYTTSPDNTLIPVIPSVEGQVILDQPPSVYFESLKNAYLYLLLFSPENKLTVLFPGADGKFPGKYQFTRFFLPKDNDWEAYLTSPGQYTAYFIITTTRLKIVEDLLFRYARAREAGNNEGTQKKLIAHLQAEIEKYKRNLEWIENTLAIPEWIGGTIRGNEDEVIYNAWSIPFQGIITHRFSFQYKTGEIHE